VKAIWERFLDYEIGHFQHVADLFKRYENRDPTEVFSGDLPPPIRYESHRDFIRQILGQETDLRARGTQYVNKTEESQASLDYRNHLNADGSPSATVAAGYLWTPGTELNRKLVVSL
jgi:hypothetical protein